MATFETGRTYRTTDIGTDMVHEITVTARTAKTVTVEGYVSGRCRIYEFDGDECIRCGSYRFAPIFCASEVA